MTQDNGKIIKRVFIKASPEVIFKALTNARDLVRWFCDRATCDPRETGELVAYWKKGKATQKGRAIFTRIIRGSELQLLWIDDVLDARSENSNHTLSYKIQARSGATEVIMHDHANPVSDEETYIALDQGWNSVLLELKDYCECRERSLKHRPQKTPTE